MATEQRHRPRRKRKNPYPNLKRMTTEAVRARCRAFQKKWVKARKGGMRLDSFSALYIGGEIDRMRDLFAYRKVRPS